MKLARLHTINEEFRHIEHPVYDIDMDLETKHIYPTDTDGNAIRVTHISSIITLTHKETGAETRFWITKYGNVYDSRRPQKPISMSTFQSEMQRMLGPETGRLMARRTMRQIDKYLTDPHSQVKLSANTALIAQKRKHIRDHTLGILSRQRLSSPKHGPTTVVKVNRSVIDKDVYPYIDGTAINIEEKETRVQTIENYIQRRQKELGLEQSTDPEVLNAVLTGEQADDLLRKAIYLLEKERDNLAEIKRVAKILRIDTNTFMVEGD